MSQTSRKKTIDRNREREVKKTRQNGLHETKETSPKKQLSWGTKRTLKELERSDEITAQRGSLTENIRALHQKEHLPLPQLKDDPEGVKKKLRELFPHVYGISLES